MGGEVGKLEIRLRSTGDSTKEHSTFDRVMFHVKLPARGADGKAEKIVQKLDVMLKNEW